MGTGFFRPLRSNSPSFIRWQAIPLTLPLLPDDLDRRDEEFDLDPLLFGGDDLLDGRGHVLALAAVEDGHVGAETGRAAGRVDGGVAAADDGDLRAEALFALRPGVFMGVEIPEELDAAVDALELLAGDAHLLALVGAGGQVDVVEIFVRSSRRRYLCRRGSCI